jgi:hypothetical protein
MTQHWVFGEKKGVRCWQQTKPNTENSKGKAQHGFPLIPTMSAFGSVPLTPVSV